MHKNSLSYEILKFILAFTLLINCYSISAQSEDYKILSNKRTKLIVAPIEGVLLDSLQVIPTSIFIRNNNGNVLPDSMFIFNEIKNTIYFPPTLNDTLYIHYRVLPISFTTSYHLLDIPSPTIKNYNYIPSYLITNDELQNVFSEGDGLRYSGSISRGISVGNSQSLGVNSSLDIQISGQINGIEIQAVLNDNTIPLEPEGTTQQIQDFDKIYIQIKKDSTKLIAGDFDIQSYSHHFLKYSKQLQGLNFNTKYKIKDEAIVAHQISAAIAKGKFARNSFIGIESNQGPYRLTGNNRESFIVIIAGSEKVYIDGKQLQRGEDNDYIMDYNTGEITFTPRFLITKDMRINIDFEYSDRYYLRSFLQNINTIDYKKWHASINVYLEQDSKNKTLLFDLDSNAIARLSSIGNNIEQAYISGAKPTEYVKDRVLYGVKDSLISGVLYDSIFYIISDSNLVSYQLNFSYLGENKGNYVPDKSSSNERVYKWVAPIDGIAQGAYEPVILLITPKKDQYVSLYISHQLNENNVLFTDYTFSNKDVNTFSSKNNNENLGHALMVGNNSKYYSKADSSKSWTNNISYQMRTSAFKPIIQYRDIEFSRDWNTSIDNNNNEHLLTHLFLYENINQKHSFFIKTELLERKKYYFGVQQTSNYKLNIKKWQLLSEMRWLKGKDSIQDLLFLRPRINLSKSFNGKYQVQIRSNNFAEHNAIVLKDTLQKSSFSFYVNELEISTSNLAPWNFNLKYIHREDYSIKNNRFLHLTSGHTLESNGKANQLKQQTLQWTMTIRNLKVRDTSITNLESEKTYLGRIEYGVRSKKNTIRWNGVYELGSGQERAREFIFLEVPSGQGVFRWLDENSDGVRQQNEFVVSQFQDSANYLKILTNLNSYVPTRQLYFGTNLFFQPQLFREDVSTSLNFFRMLSASSQIAIRRKTFKGSEYSAFNPFIFNSNDSNLVNFSLTLRHGIQFNQGNPVYSITYLSSINQEKTLLTNGFDVRLKNEHQIQAYYNINKSYTLNIKTVLGRNTYNSDFFESNNYFIKLQSLEPSFSYIFKTNLKVSLSYYFANKINKPEFGSEKSQVHKTSLDAKYNIAGNFAIQTNMAFAQVKYNGLNNSTKSYIMLEGLQPNKNILWNIRAEKFIGNNLQISLEYDGRKSNTANAVHTGRLNVRALF